MVEKSEETKTKNMVEDAQIVAERLSRENDRSEDILKRLEILESRKILGGESMAGSATPQQKEESPREYASRMMRGGV